MQLPENHIHIESTSGRIGHVAQHVYVDGHPVLIEDNGLDISFGPDEMTVVTLRVTPKTVTFGGALDA